MILTLIRHGETDWNAERRFQGHRDPPLNTEGRLQAAALGETLARQAVGAIYCSDLKRAAETASAIATHHELTLTTDPRLRELSFGEWEGLTHDQIQEGDGERYRRWQEDWTNRGPPGGEHLSDLAARISAFCEDLPTDQNVLIVAHGGSLRVLLCELLELPTQNYWRFRLSNASVSEIAVYPSGAVVQRWNDTAHLK